MLLGMLDLPLLELVLLVFIPLLVYRVWWQKAAKAVHKTAAVEAPEKNKRNTDWETVDFSDTQPICPKFSWKDTPEKAYRPWSNGPYFVTMGLKQTSIQDWVEIDKTYLDRLRYKRQIFAEHPEKTVQVMPGSEEPCYEALYLLVDLLPRKYPSMFVKTVNGIQNLVTDENWDLRRESSVWESHHPLQVMGLLTTEDWFIMQSGDDDQTRLQAGANCFPAGWKIQERIGHSLMQIHGGKVPQYEERLAKSMDRFFLRLRVDSPIMRFNYAIDNSPELFHIHSHHNLTADQLAAPLTIDQLHLRVERQFLQRLPRSRAMVFSIRTYVTPITEVVKDREVAKALRTSVGSYTEDVAHYKNKPLWDAVLEEHLQEILGDKEETPGGGA